MEIDSRKEYIEYAFLQYTECTDLQDGAAHVLDGARLRWSSGYETHYSTTAAQDRNNLKKKRVRKRLGVERPAAIKTYVPAVSGNYGVASFA